jgi:hypothetical protein
MPYASNPTKVVLKNRDFWLSGAALGVPVFLWRRLLQELVGMLTDGVSSIIHSHSIGDVFAGLFLLTFLLAIPSVPLCFFLRWAIHVYAGKLDELQLAYKLNHSGACKRHARYNCKTCRRWQQNGSRCGVWAVAAATLFVVLGLGIFFSQFHEPDKDEDVRPTGYGLITSSAIGLYTVCGVILIFIVGIKESRKPEEWNWDRNNPPDMRFVDEPLELTWRRLSSESSLPFLDSKHVPLLQIGFYPVWSVVVARSLSPFNFGLLRVAVTSMALYWIAIHWTFKYRGLSQGLRTIDPVLRRRTTRIRAQAENGDVGAQYALAVCLETGKGALIDEQEPSTWYTKSAVQGNALAQNRLGMLCFYRRDREGAEVWFRKAAEQGYSPAFISLGRLYAYGPDQLVSADEYNAATISEELVRQHMAFNMHEWAKSQPKEYSAAYFWLSLAGIYEERVEEREQVERELVEIGAKLSAQERADIQAHVDEWQGSTDGERRLLAGEPVNRLS